MQSEGVKKSERYSSGGGIAGGIGIVGLAAGVGVGLFDSRADFPAWIYSCAVLLAVAIWALMLRPAVVLDDDGIELRNVLQSVWVPYARIKDVAVTQFTTIRTTDERKFTGSGFGRTRRAMKYDQARAGEGTAKNVSIGWLVEDKIQRRADAARDLAGAPGDATAEARRAWALPEIASLSLAAVVTLVLAALA